MGRSAQGISPFIVQSDVSNLWLQTVDGPVTNLDPMNPIATVVMIKPMQFSLTEYISYDLVASEKGPSSSVLFDIKVCPRFQKPLAIGSWWCLAWGS